MRPRTSVVLTCTSVLVAIVLSGCLLNLASPGTADITFTITPSVFWVGVQAEVTCSISESNGVGVDLNYLRATWYDEQGGTYREEEREGEEAQELLDEVFGTHYLPPNVSLQITAPGPIIETGPSGRVVVIVGGTDDNGNFVTDSWEGEIRA